MKKLNLILALVFLSFASLETNAQAFGKGTINLTIGVGGTDMFEIGTYAGNFYGGGIYGFGTGPSSYNPVTGQFIFQGEFAVHKYVGIGFNTGVGGRIAPGSLYGANSGVHIVNVPIGILANFHFYQLIADKKPGKNLHADKLDIYAGASFGSGAVIYTYSGDGISGRKGYAVVYGGPHVGINYFFTPMIGINGEFGFGQSFAQAGLVIKVKGAK